MRRTLRPGHPDDHRLTRPAHAERPGPSCRPPTTVVTTTASDAHVWNLVYLELLLTEWGHHVVNLGPCVPDGLLVHRCLAVRPDLLVVSSVNGHGRDEGQRLISRVRARPELAALPAVIGGKLDTGAGDRARSAAELLAAGFDLVVDEAEGLEPLRAFAMAAVGTGEAP